MKIFLFRIKREKRKLEGTQKIAGPKKPQNQNTKVNQIDGDNLYDEYKATQKYNLYKYSYLIRYAKSYKYFLRNSSHGSKARFGPQTAQSADY